MDIVFLGYFITSRALVEAGGLCSSRANIPIRKARLWYSSRSLNTVSKKAALDKVLVAIHVCLLVDTLFFLPCLRRNLSQDTFLNILNDSMLVLLSFAIIIDRRKNKIHLDFIPFAEESQISVVIVEHHCFPDVSPAQHSGRAGLWTRQLFPIGLMLCRQMSHACPFQGNPSIQQTLLSVTTAEFSEVNAHFLVQPSYPGTAKLLTFPVMYIMK